MVDDAPKPLPTTSYAVLGLLSLRSWTGYELTQQFQRSLAFCLPKAESVLYEEPRRLTRLGLATTTKEPAGRRTRNRYAITEAGRQALADWLAATGEPPKLEIEPMLRLLFADQGTTADLEGTLHQFRSWARDQRSSGLPVVADIIDPGSELSGRAHLQSLFARYFAELYDLTERFCDEAEAELSTWTSTEGQGLTPGALAAAQAILDRG